MFELINELPEIADNLDRAERMYAVHAQELYSSLLSNVPTDSPHYPVYKIFCSYAKRILFKALCEGYLINTPECTEYMDNLLRGNRILVGYLAHNGVNIEDLLT
jgi:hypothetical protein